MDAHTTDDSLKELRDLRLVVDWGFVSLIPLTLLFASVGLMAGSLTIYTVTLDYGLSLIVNLFAFVAIRTMLKKSVFTFPYGIGKLENFTSLLYGALLVPTGGFLIFAATSRIVNPREGILFGASEIPMALSLARSAGLLVMTLLVAKRSQGRSSLISSYIVTYKVALITDACVIAILGMAMFFEHWGMGWAAAMTDTVATVLLTFYMLANGGRLVADNFKSLMDLPLPEEDQIKILAVLTSEYANYVNLGNVYTRRSGNKRLIELELVFEPQTALASIAEVERRMRDKLFKSFPDVVFQLIPMTGTTRTSTQRNEISANDTV